VAGGPSFLEIVIRDYSLSRVKGQPRKSSSLDLRGQSGWTAPTIELWRPAAGNPEGSSDIRVK